MTPNGIVESAEMRRLLWRSNPRERQTGRPIYISGAWNGCEPSGAPHILVFEVGRSRSTTPRSALTQALRPLKMTENEITDLFKNIATGFRDQIRSPILATPASKGLQFEDVTFPSEDGVPLEAWFIPCEGSSKLVIANHPRWFNRYGLPAHLEPWKSTFKSTGNDFEVNFISDYKILHDAGYNVLTYDFRNHGQSGSANGSLVTNGVFESRDVVGSLDYVRSRPDLDRMTVGLLSRCLGCSSTIVAMARRPERFSEVKCMVGVQPLAVRTIMERTLASAGIPPHRIEDLDAQMRLSTSFSLDDLSPVDSASSVDVPTLLYQVRNDSMLDSSIVQTIYDAIRTSEKHLHWIEGTTRRWDGYTYFAREPKISLDWFARYMN